MKNSKSQHLERRGFHWSCFKRHYSPFWPKWTKWWEHLKNRFVFPRACESHHSVPVYVSNYPALLRTTVLDYMDASGFAFLHWHPNTTGPRTTVGSISDNISNLLFILPWMSQTMLHLLWFLKMEVVSGLSSPLVTITSPPAPHVSGSLL